MESSGTETVKVPAIQPSIPGFFLGLMTAQLPHATRGPLLPWFTPPAAVYCTGGNAALALHDEQEANLAGSSRPTLERRTRRARGCLERAGINGLHRSPGGFPRD
jgi:hypothetical protein